MMNNISCSVLVILVCCISTAYFEAMDFDQACSTSQTLTAEEGEIYSPGFKENKNYPLNIDCNWIIKVVWKMNIRLELKFLDIEDRIPCHAGDYLRLTFKNEGDPKLYLWRHYCGSNFNPTLFVTSRLNETIFINFYSDYIHTRKGFLLHYQFTTDPSLCGEGELLCKNNHCVPTSVICDLKDDCGDGTDEEDCKIRLDQHAECGVPLEEPDLRIESRVVGGKEAVLGSWPWQIDLESFNTNDHQCGGVLINSQYVLTARHCISEYPRPMFWRIHLGTHNVSHKDEHEQIRNVKSVHVPEPDFETLDKDIALLRLSAEVKYTKHVRPVCLPPPDFHVKGGTICYTSGWGTTKGSGASSVLKQVPVEIVDACNFTGRIPPNYKSSYNPRTMVCVNTHHKDGGSCSGDSGGPLVCQVDEKWYLLGLVSFGIGNLLGSMCGIENWFNVYQKVAPHLQWIEDIIKTGE